MRRLLLCSVLLGATALAGCVALGFSQAESEQAYATSAGITDGGIILGKLTPDQTGTACVADGAYYANLISTRNPADGVKSYAPADNAHAKLQADGSHLNPTACIPPAPA